MRAVFVALVVALAGCEQNAEHAKRPPAEKPAEKEAAPAPKAEKANENRVEYGKGIANFKHVEVEIKSPSLGWVQVHNELGQSAVQTGNDLAITVRIRVTDPAKRFYYRSWRGPATGGKGKPAALSDDVGNTYAPVSFGKGMIPNGGVEDVSLDSHSPVDDVIVFEEPVAAAKWLNLDLPVHLDGADGVIKYRISTELIRKAR